MQYNVAQLLKELSGATRHHELDEPFECEGEGWDPLRVSGHVQMLRSHRGLVVTAQLETTVPLACSRCLEHYSECVKMELAEEFFPVIDVHSGLPVNSQQDQDEDSFTIDQNHILDLTEAVRQAVVLALPIKPLCNEDCAGLCAECGANLNQHPCSCATPDSDPRWAKLKRLQVS